jgi:hypothetical protein
MLDYSLEEITLRFFLIVIIPTFIFIYPSIRGTLADKFNHTPNPLRWLSEKIREIRYMKKWERERQREKETLEQAERIMRMHAEEAERQRQFEREQAERQRQEQARETGKSKTSLELHTFNMI